MMDLGVMPKQHHDCMEASMPCSCGEDQKKPHYPTLNLDSENLPEVENYDVGQTVMLTFKAKVVGKNTESFWGNGTHMEFKLLEGQCKGAGPKMNDAEGDAPVTKTKDYMDRLQEDTQDNEDDQEDA